MDLTGIHHLTAVSANIRENYRFYTAVMGMRLVKRSVNQDDVRAYHLFYSDAVGSPGNDLTFFDWNVPREQRGTHSITRTALRVHGEGALRWWETHLRDHGVQTGTISERDARLVLDFEDPEGQRLTLIDDGGAGDETHPWERSSVPAEYQIRGLGPITISVPNLRPTDIVLTKALNMRPVRQYAHPETPEHTVYVYEMGQGGPDKELHVAVQPGLPFAQGGAGGVHHVAFRVPDEEQYHAWTERLANMGIRTSGEVDRYYFRSLYFREPGGILFELATDGPGFAVDEDPATLGESVVLPPFLEPRRAEILANLKPID
ncbi:ring-cleaving dioxygenase [Deinococcus peraridilitoris]|uniref:Lactoylglutathione lyase-like lyase n=1 Tax=Deinococcus peraridilitoris (strain DSM 19664 / LMG 22246 / CIP 109416 / KR-200) TaxID=937777 RepID=L0A0B5_DEIPD|nr:ring-cleaving dioxygenase [Deinococcus peraridilitoris]AFZ67333.1 lactoylglutathione lyase-like lyase [Deinococcus peraridilitoris DSM 19664]